MLKLLTHVLVFAIGAGTGVYWGVHHPAQAQNLSDIEQTRLDQAKQQVLKVVPPPPQQATP